MLTPVIIGFGINYLALGAFLAAVILTGQLMANFLSNSGGAWDNAKKYIEDGHEGGKGSEAHKAAVIGDTVGDPFKDTAGPALNPLIKVMNLVSLLILPAVIKLRDNNGARYSIAGVALVVLIGAIAFSKRKATAMDDLGRSASAPEVRRPSEAALAVAAGSSPPPLAAPARGQAPAPPSGPAKKAPRHECGRGQEGYGADEEAERRERSTSIATGTRDRAMTTPSMSSRCLSAWGIFLPSR